MATYNLECFRCGSQFVAKSSRAKWCSPKCGRKARTSGSTTAAGYGADHQRERAKWERVLQRDGKLRCQAKACLKSTRVIGRDDDWDLGHTEDRTAWTGPEHEQCNRSEGARRRGKKTLPKRWVL